MDQVEVDVVLAQATEAGPHRVDEVVVPEVAGPDLRGYEEVSPVVGLYGLAHQLLGVAGAVVLGGVNVGHPEPYAGPEGLHLGAVPGAVGLVPAPDAPGSHAEDGDPNSLDDLPVLQFCFLRRHNLDPQGK